ncbi:siderophore-interacting protein [Acidovorax sp. CCYZU-2555]|uniref:siderophore-interacting protein n=1 Tax=Acidovorax sp. CCYZU-2555 TaxID=2835042 RepID=UPI001BCD508D|nr:siderophore-interacting protein [Acidovorax sp. CCYZU-2555]MBS7781442.1 siderophore-interacting protein [Acidovorax sp. CCYZU-2555]
MLPKDQAITPRASEDHNRGLHEVDATVISLDLPSAHTLRVGIALATSADDPGWTLPNVAFRIHLDDRTGAVSRIYTARSFSAVQARVEFDVVRHGADSPMMRWAAFARVGDALRLTGPRANIQIPEARGRRVALFLDDAAIPALHSILHQWPAGTQGQGWIATDDTHALAELPRIAGLQLHRVPLQAPGAQLLLQQARQLPDAASHVVWGAGERDEMRAIRQHFHTLVGLGKEDVAIAGYWKSGASNTEIDAQRQAAYGKFIAAGATLAEWDDLAIAI